MKFIGNIQIKIDTPEHPEDTPAQRAHSASVAMDILIEKANAVGGEAVGLQKENRG